ncbi:MAG: Uma2 family endonuclease [Anaerolineae bacterium]|nr:Uma2 family endonuclease [Anaerolineae bacterium]
MILFISAARFQQVRSKSYLDVVPELVAEVLSPDDRWTDVEQKLRDYFAAGVKLAWVINPETRSVFVYRSIKTSQVLEETDTLTGEDVLPGFSVKIADLFE